MVTTQLIDLRGFSIGSFAAQEVALIRPDLVRRIVRASSASQGAAGMHGWAIPNHSLLQRVAAIEHPVSVADGDSDPMILPRFSYLLAGLLPDVRIKIYPDAAHGFLFQHHAEFAGDVHSFLAGG